MIEVPAVLSAAGAIPLYVHEGDAGADLFAQQEVELAAQGGRARIRTGVSLELPEGVCALVVPRSGLATDHGITCLNAPGLIDSGYRGEIQVLLANLDPSSSYVVHVGDRIAQLLLVSFERAVFVLAETLSTSDRGAGGFGHSGR